MTPPAERRSFPPAEGVRLVWAALPVGVRASIERRFGARVEAAESQPAGFSPGVASRLRLADGRRAFVKAVHGDANPDSPGIHRREAVYLAHLPADAAVPRLLWTDEWEGWVVLAIEDIDGGTPPLPWRHEDLDRVVVALGELSRRFTPSPVNAPAFLERHVDTFRHWRSAPAPPPGTTQLPPEWDRWVVDHFEELQDLEAGWTAGANGATLLHCDVRADNILLAPDRVVFVDWPWACVGAPWLDWVLFLPSVAMQGGPDPWTVFDAQAPVGRPEEEAVTGAIAGFAGFLVDNGSRPAPPGLPTLRAFQRAQGVECLRWIRHRTGWT